MLNNNVEKEIDRFVRYIRKMDSIKDDVQLSLLLQLSYHENWDGYTSIGIDIPGHVRFIRQTALLSDDQLRAKLRKQYEWDFRLQHIFDDAAQKRALNDMSNAAKDVRSDPRKFARKIDRELME